ncbi:MAG: efflux RND transporter permease subunit [Verrucomicrobiota bacterium]
MIRWFTENGVAANLLAGIVIVVGLFVASTIKLELFPSLDLDTVSITVPYPGAAPKEVESGIVELIEIRIQDVEGIKRIRSTAAEGIASVVAEIERGYDATEVANRIEVRIDAIENFPDEAEEARVEEILIRSEVISLAIHGQADVRVLKEVAEYIRDELNIREDISQVDIAGVADFEISIEVSESSLRQYGLTFDEVTLALQDSSIDVPGGTIRSPGGEILLRTPGKAYSAEEFAAIPVRTLPDGGSIRIGDIAEVIDGYVDDPLITEFNGNRAVLLNVYAVGNQSALELSSQVQRFAEEIAVFLPAGIEVEPFRDFTYYLKGRLRMLIENGIIGLLLVLIILTIFLRPSLAFFVMLGIPISFLGSIIFLPWLGVSINLASLFGFILVLGIVVDDAIIVGESVFTNFQKHGGPGVAASVAGTKKVSIPVTFAILTTIVAFIPILTIPGFLGKFFFPIPVVVIAALIWSLIESKLILPYHLTLCKVGGGDREELSWLSRQQRKVADGLENFVEKRYRPFIKHAIEFRYMTAAIFVSIFIVMAGLIAGKHIPFVFFPPVPSDYIVAKLVMPEGTSIEVTTRAVEQMKRGLDELIAETKGAGYGEPFQNAVITIGAQPFEGANPMAIGVNNNTANKAEIAVELTKREELIDGGDNEAISSPNLANRWRELIGPIPGVKELTFNANAAGQAGAPIDIQISARDFEQLQEVAEKIKTKLNTYEGLFDVRDNYSSGKREIQLDINPAAENLGLRRADLGRQVRSAFYGVEVQRIQRGRDEIKVMVRYPKDERVSVENLDELRIRTPSGAQVPFEEVADYEITEGFAAITRVDRRRVLNITADANKGVADLNLIKEELAGIDTLFRQEQGYIDSLLGDYPGVSWSFEGEAREQKEIFGNLTKMSMIAAFIIYALLAVPLKSYIQPVIVMIVIPFGLIGAVAGHILMFQPMSILSVLGFVALAGVVVNDSLVLIDFINEELAAGRPLHQAIEEAGALRFRPIILTSMTTFAGLIPLLFETSLQAQFLIPMAISLSFGVLFATFITLILVPSFYFILEDLRKLGLRLLK